MKRDIGELALAVVMISASPESLEGVPHPAPVLLKPVTMQMFLDARAAHAVCAPDDNGA